MRKKSYLFLCSLMLCLLSACHPNKEPDYTNYLKIGYLPSTDLLPYIVAEQQGIFDSLQLDIKLMPMETAFDRDSLFRVKVTDGVILSPNEAFQLQEEGISAIPTFKNQGIYYIVASPDSTITKLAHLNKKTISLTRGSAYDFFADKAIERMEVNPDNVNKPELSSEQLRCQMLTNGQIDAAVLRDPYASTALMNGCKVLSSSSLYPISLSVTAFSDSILNTKKKDVKKLIICYNLAVKYMNTHPKQQWLAPATSVLGLRSLLIKLPNFNRTSALTEKEVNELLEWMKVKKALPEKCKKMRNNRALVNEVNKPIKK